MEIEKLKERLKALEQDRKNEEIIIDQIVQEAQRRFTERSGLSDKIITHGEIRIDCGNKKPKVILSKDNMKNMHERELEELDRFLYKLEERLRK